jgi:site-specific recombinase XerD
MTGGAMRQTLEQPSTAVATWVVVPELPAQPGIGVDDRDEDAIKAQIWPLAFEQWIAGGWRSHGDSISEQTRRAYRRSVDEFQAFIGDRYPMWRAMGSQVIAWQNSMRASSLSETTINLRLAGLSSLYEFLCHKFCFPDPRNTRQEMFLCDRNPVKAASRTKVNPYENDKAGGLTEDEMLAMLRRIDQAKLEGIRDYALITALFATGQRSAAIASLRWGDIEVKGEGAGAIVYYRWRSKAKKGVDELVRPAYDAICAYLAAAGRLATIAKDDFIFTPLSDIGTRLAQRKAQKNGRTLAAADGPACLTGARVNQIVKHVARRAGLDETRIHTHTLRHTAALFLKHKGADLIQIQQTLHHSNVNTTMIYLKGIDRERHPLWKSVGDFFGMV